MRHVKKKKSLLQALKDKIIIKWEAWSGTNPYELVFDRDHNPTIIKGFTADGKWFIFRAKGNWLRMVVCNDESDFRGYVSPETPYPFERFLDYGVNVNDAGWIPHKDAILMCTIWLNEYYGVTSCRSQSSCKQFKASKRAMKKLEEMAQAVQYRRIQFEKDS